MSVNTRNVLLLAVSLIWARSAAAQGIYWEVTTSSPGSSHTAQAYAVPKMLKVVGDDGNAMILRGDREKLITTDAARRAYSEFTFAELEASAKATQAKMEQQLKHLDPGQRTQIEQVLRDQGAAGIGKAPAVDVKKTNETKTVNGYRCTKWVATSRGKTVLVAWTTDHLKGFDKLHDDWMSYQRRFASLSGTLSASAVARTKIDGFPMETEAGSVKTVVTKVEPRAIPASEFEVPAGYTKESTRLPGLK
jgi:hypothetical protein